MSISGAAGTPDAAEIDRITNIVIPSAARTVDGAKPKKKLAVFKLQARALMGYVRKGQLDHTRAVDVLHEIAEANGLLDIHGHDAIAEIITAAAKPPRKSDRPVIKIVGNELPRMVDEAEAALIKTGRDVYCYGGQLVRPVVDEVPAADMTRTRIHRLVPVIRAHLVEIFTEVILWRRYDGRRKDWIDVDCPDCVAETYLARDGAWKLPPLVGVINAPMLRADGSLLDTPGYDAGTGLLYRPDGIDFGVVPARPTRDDADRALCLLEDLVSTFPFAADADRAVALSAILSALDRRAVPTSPLHAFTAPVAGSGKSMLVDICSAIATGRAAPVLDQSREDIETDKRLAAALLRGSSIVSIDNCERPLDSSFLCQALTTAGVMRIRPLGVSKDIDIPNTAMFYATGNNLTVVGDLTRRVVVCRLDPKCERPELREFQCDPLAMVAADRPAYVVAALTVLRAYLTAEDRVTVPPVGSYGDWSKRVREALVWLGRADPCDTMMAIRAEDPIAVALAALIDAWDEAIGPNKPVTVQTLIEMTGRHDLSGSYQHAALREALFAVAADGREINARRLGKWLARRDSRIIHGRKIVKDGALSHKTAQWVLIEG